MFYYSNKKLSFLFWSTVTALSKWKQDEKYKKNSKNFKCSHILCCLVELQIDLDLNLNHCCWGAKVLTTAPTLHWQWSAITTLRACLKFNISFYLGSVWPENNCQMSIKVAQKWFHLKNDRFWHLCKNCLRMWEIWVNKLLPKALKIGPKSKKCQIWWHCLGS